MNKREAAEVINDILATGFLIGCGLAPLEPAGKEQYAAMNMGIDTLRATEWIPVEERLPDSEDMVLVSCVTAKGYCSVNRAYYSGNTWHGSGSMAGVIAWMPLPEPYKL